MAEKPPLPRGGTKGRGGPGQGPHAFVGPPRLRAAFPKEGAAPRRSWGQWERKEGTGDSWARRARAVGGGGEEGWRRSQCASRSSRWSPGVRRPHPGHLLQSPWLTAGRRLGAPARAIQGRGRGGSVPHIPTLPKMVIPPPPASATTEEAWGCWLPRPAPAVSPEVLGGAKLGAGVGTRPSAAQERGAQGPLGAQSTAGQRLPGTGRGGRAGGALQ